MTDETTEETEPTDVPNYITPISERPPEERPPGVERAIATIRDRFGDGALAIGGGLAAFAIAALSAGRSRGRALASSVIGAALVGYGVRRRRSGGTFAGQFTSDDESDDTGAASDPDVEFTDDGDEPRGKPDLDGSEGDPRTDHDVDETIEIDVSDAALADESGEATGPDPEQAQPTRTEATEPDPSPAEEPESADDADVTEDASDKRVEPDDDDRSADETSEAESDQDDEAD